MGLLDGTNQQQYYQGSDHGNYQFVSLTDIINQFMFVYVGEDKIIPKARRADVAFHAQRALAELSFDTFKSCKAQEISVPASLQMILPHDYVNYTKISWVDSAGIKHPIYPTNNTSNPFSILQDDAGDYVFISDENLVINGDFTSLAGWAHTLNGAVNKSWRNVNIYSGKYFAEHNTDTLQIVNGELEFGAGWSKLAHGNISKSHAAWRPIDLSNTNSVDLRAIASSGDQQHNAVLELICDYGSIRVGLTTTDPDIGFPVLQPSTGTYKTEPATIIAPPLLSPNQNSANFDLGYLEWSDGTTSEKELLEIDVSNVSTAWLYIQSNSPWTAESEETFDTGTQGGTTPITPNSSTNNTLQKNTVNSVEVITFGAGTNIVKKNADGNSTTWNNYKSSTPSENNNDDYEDDTYWPINGSRYGLDPQHANVNGSFYIDCMSGKIHFSSNIAGKTVILDYISDSLGTDGEMQVHKFAEEAMYKWISHAVMAGRINIPEYQVNRFKKERFAAVRTAKLRLSNIKLEEITQILRGKSKQIKH